MRYLESAIMSGQPTGNASTVPRPATNGITSSNMAPSQQRPNDPQVGSSSATNGQPGGTSQSNLNNIVRRRFFKLDLLSTFLNLLIFFASITEMPNLRQKSVFRKMSLRMKRVAQ